MSRFIAAMDHSGGSTGGVLERYGQEYTEENKMELVHEMRLRMIGSKDFNNENIWAAIVYKDSVEKGIVNELTMEGIETILKIDSGCEEDGTLKVFDVQGMCDYANLNHCTGTKMRSIVKTPEVLDVLLDQQFEYAQQISDNGLVPIIEPEVPIEHEHKQGLEIALFQGLKNRLDNYFDGKCILKLTLPEYPDMYRELTRHKKVVKVVGLSGGYSTEEACRRLSLQDNMTASFSRALSEGLFAHQTDEEFEDRISSNIKMIVEAGNE